MGILLAVLAAQAREASEYEVKSAFLYHFAQFAEWPSESFAKDDSPFVIGVLGKDPFGETLDRTLRGKRLQGRRIEVRRSQKVDGVREAHLLFISGSERDRMKTVLDALQGLHILTVAEYHGLAKAGCSINLYVEERRVRFEINPRAADRAGLKLSSKLLSLARLVEE